MTQKDKIKELATNIDKLELAEQRYPINEFDNGMYDDEYDDTYDTNEVGADDADETLELMGRYGWPLVLFIYKALSWVSG